MNYFNGYYDIDSTADTIAATPDATYIPNWVHIFNAHVLPKKSGGSTPHVSSAPAAATDANGIRIVIANPQARCQTIVSYKIIQNKALGRVILNKISHLYFAFRKI